MSDLRSRSAEELDQLQQAAERHLLLNKGKKELLEFARQMMPDPEATEDLTKSLYVVAPHNRVICEAVQEVIDGVNLRLALAVPPQHGKTRSASISAIAHYIGKYPHRNILFGTYNEKYARKIGSQVRDYVRSKRFQALFPQVKLKAGSKSKDEMETIQGGQINFIGRGGSGTGLPADLVIIDDPLKNADEARSPAVVEAMHEWYTKVIYSRVRTTTAIILIHTRWLEDDLIGRECDPDHPDRNKDAKGRVLASDSSNEWMYINLPAVLGPGALAQALGVKLEPSNDPLVRQQFGHGPLAALWPAQFSLRHLATAKRKDPVGFSALYMGTPTPETGDYFNLKDLVEYDADELPSNLRKYGASDHAVTERKDRDPAVIGCIGVDADDNIWVLPDLVMKQMKTDKMTDEMVNQMKRHRPLLWWAEGDVIQKSIGPFLIKRMKEEQVYTVLVPKTPSSDKLARARSIQGRTQMRKVFFPRFASWWHKAKAQMLRFPRARNDDFVDWLAWIGLGLIEEISARAPRKEDEGIKVGTLAWVKASAEKRRQREKRIKAAGGF